MLCRYGSLEYGSYKEIDVALGRVFILAQYPLQYVSYYLRIFKTGFLA